MIAAAHHKHPKNQTRNESDEWPVPSKEEETRTDIAQEARIIEWKEMKKPNNQSERDSYVQECYKPKHRSQHVLLLFNELKTHHHRLHNLVACWRQQLNCQISQLCSRFLLCLVASFWLQQFMFNSIYLELAGSRSLEHNSVRLIWISIPAVPNCTGNWFIAISPSRPEVNWRYWWLSMTVVA